MNEAGEAEGIVEETFEIPAHEVMVIRQEEGAPVVYVPFTLEHVPEVDLEGGVVVVRPPEV
jgi:16S rRNA processing protein RimM